MIDKKRIEELERYVDSSKVVSLPLVEIKELVEYVEILRCDISMAVSINAKLWEVISNFIGENKAMSPQEKQIWEDFCQAKKDLDDLVGMFSKGLRKEKELDLDDIDQINRQLSNISEFMNQVPVLKTQLLKQQQQGEQNNDTKSEKKEETETQE